MTAKHIARDSAQIIRLHEPIRQRIPRLRPRIVLHEGAGIILAPLFTLGVISLMAFIGWLAK